MLTVEELVVRFGGLTAVDGCSFEIAAGSVTGLIGPNGAGKTTTFNAIAGAITPSGGRIVLRGRDVTGRKPHEMFAAGLARTFQIPHEFTRLTTLENLMAVPAGQDGENLLKVWFAPGAVAQRENAVLEQAEETLDFLGLVRVRDELAGNLSGGQKKLLELGRAMMSGADLVLLDEPGAGVNPTLLGRLADRIQVLNEKRGITFCIIEHNMDLIARLCDPVIVMAQGKVLTQGPMTEIRKDRRVLEAYLGSRDAEPAT